MWVSVYQYVSEVSGILQYKGYRYYKENPSLMVWEAIEKILVEIGLI